MNGRVQPRLMLGFLLILLVILALGSANMGGLIALISHAMEHLHQ